MIRKSMFAAMFLGCWDVCELSTKVSRSPTFDTAVLSGYLLQFLWLCFGLWKPAYNDFAKSDIFVLLLDECLTMRRIKSVSLCSTKYRDRSILIRGIGAKDSWQFPLFCGSMKILRAISMGYKTIHLDKFWVKSSIKD